jgi:hypothetical protein
MEAVGPVLIVLSIPLMFGWVPRNRLYGFRVPATLRDDEVWYAINARSARQFCALGLALVTLEFVLPPSLRDATLAGLAFGGFAAITIANWRRANRLAVR